MFTNQHALAILKWLLNGQAIAGMADIPSNGNQTVFYASLHTADPGAAGTQESNELVYTGYERVAVSRAAAGWTITGSSTVTPSASPTSRIEFPEMRGGNAQQAVWVGLGTAKSGAGSLQLRGKLDPSIACAVGVVPAIKTTATIKFVTQEA